MLRCEYGMASRQSCAELTHDTAILGHISSAEKNMHVTLYHNPACSTSRNALALVRARGIEPQIIEYLKTPPTRAELAELIAAMGITPRALLRSKEMRYRELDLDDAKWSDAELIAFMVDNPILMNRPIVVTPLGTRLGRPSADAVLEVLPPAA